MNFITHNMGSTVGTAAVISSGVNYLKRIEIPIVGEFVAIYGASRLSWDFGSYMGYYYGPSTWYMAQMTINGLNKITNE